MTSSQFSICSNSMPSTLFSSFQVVL